MAKSQVDDETIEEAIARLILVHNEDETAHLDTGQSLQSHKASEIIDHLAASIIADKIKDWEVVKLGGSFDRTDFHWITFFESLDGFSQLKTLTGYITLWGTALEIGTGATINSYALIYKELYVSNAFSWDQNRRLRTRIYFNTNTNQTMYFAFGNTQSIPTTKFIGFKVLNGDIYAVVSDGSTETLVDTTINISVTTAYDFEVIYTAGVDAKFYINGVLKATISSDLPSGLTNANSLLSFFVSSQAAANKSIYVSYWDIWQNI